jgi:histidyl-tRNA synthetase
MKKQMKYADQRNIPFVILIGEQEMETKQYTLKNMQTGDQQKLTTDDIIKKLNSNQ